MIGVNKKIVVKVDAAQKEMIRIAGIMITTAKEYNTNYRERSPVIAESVKDGSKFLCHHNMFYGATCPYSLGDDLFAIPYKPNTVFCKLDSNGNAVSILGNIICERVIIESTIDLPPESQKPYLDRVRVKSAGSGFKEGDLLFVIPYSPYHICYTWNGEQKEVVKVFREDIVGVLKQ